MSDPRKQIFEYIGLPFYEGYSSFDEENATFYDDVQHDENGFFIGHFNALILLKKPKKFVYCIIKILKTKERK